VSATRTQWDQAQAAERAYHCDGDITARRATSRMHRRWYAAMLDIPATCDRSFFPGLVPRVVAEFGCGPQGMVLETPLAAPGSLAIDPLTFLPEDEARYEKAGMVRLRHAGELPVGHPFEESWVCNVLQHTVNPDAVLAQAVTATRAVRLFEWVDVPTDELHLHVLTEGRLTGPLAQAGFRCVGESRGERAKRHPTHGDEWRQRYYAGVWVRR
jgi:hypothetical protein